MSTNLAQKCFILLEENEQLLARIKELEAELYTLKVQLMHAENTLYSK